MTIDDRLTRAGQNFRDTHAEPADVHLAPSVARRPARAPRPRRRLIGIAVAVCTVVALTVGVTAWVASSSGSPDRIVMPGASTPPTTADLYQGSWQLAEADGGSGHITLPTAPHFPLTLQFDSTKGQYTVSDGCNDIGGNVTVDGSALRFDQATTTLVACADDQELRSAIGDVFQGGSATWAVDGGTLTLTRGGTTLTYARMDQQSALTLGSWLLVSIAGGSGREPLPSAPASQLSLQFDLAAHQFSVQDGCDLIGAGYSVDGSRLAFGQSRITLVGCGDDASLVHVISPVFAAGSASWALSGRTLTISRDGTILIYTRG